MSTTSLKVNNALLSPMSQMVNHLSALHSGRKVRATASMLIFLHVKNIAAKVPPLVMLDEVRLMSWDSMP